MELIDIGSRARGLCVGLCNDFHGGCQDRGCDGFCLGLCGALCMSLL